MTTITTRATKGSPLSWVEADANFTNLNDDKAEVSAVDLKAPLDSPSLTGVPTAPTAVNGTNTTQLATTAFVQGKTAAQTPSTAIGNIVATNVQAALEELDTEKASLTGATFSGQVTATKLQTGVSGTNTNNFILDASAADGTMKLARGDGQDIMTVDTARKVAFSVGVFGFSFGTSGSYGRYIKFPSWLGGFCIQANTVSVSLDTNGEAPITLPTAFANTTYAVVVSNSNASVGPNRIYSTYSKGTAAFRVVSVLSTTGAPTASTTAEVSYIVFGIGA